MSGSSTSLRRPQRGFTLIELLIVVVLVAILAAIAFPQYRDYVVRSNRSVAKSLLTQVADRQEQFYTSNKRYSTGLDELGFVGDPFYVNRNGQTGTSSAGAIYVIDFDAADNTTFTVSATVQGPQAEDTRCTKFLLNETGRRTAEGTATDCW